MDIYFHGLTSIRIKGKKTTLVTNPHDVEKTGVKMEKVAANAVLLSRDDDTNTDLKSVSEYTVLIKGPGEYEVGGTAITGYHLDTITAYYIKMDNLTLLYLGPLEKIPNVSELEKLPEADIVFIPVGGGGSLNAKQAAELVTKLEMIIVVPMQFQPENASKVKIALDLLDPFLKEMGKEATAQSKLSITKEKLPAELEVVWLS